MSDASERYLFDRAIEAGMHARIAGIDEAGRGPLAGPVVAAAVCLDPADPIEGVNDSKKLSAPRRAELYDEILRRARGYGIGSASVEEIDRHNILRATFLAMRRAVDRLAAEWSLALVDGNTEIPTLVGHRQLTVVGGDAKSASIAAASILAKVTRDRLMDEYHRQYPRYGFDRHKGYGTPWHREQLLRFGLCPIHRRSFCESLLAQTELELNLVPQGVPA